MINALIHLTQRPDLFEPGDESIWIDPHVAGQMLQLHLNPDTDAASRKPETIDKTVAWISERCGLQPGDALLDLGCGPGLYCRRFAQRGLRVTGVDMSTNSLDYARQHDPKTTYIEQDYTHLQLEGQFQAITLIYGDFCVLPGAGRDALLAAVWPLLVPGGYFVFDVMTPKQYVSLPPKWWNVNPDGGFWKPGPYIELVQTFRYPEHDTICNQYIIAEADQTLSLYRVWHHGYTVDTITPILAAHGFEIAGFYGNLTGAAHDPEGDWVGVVARRPVL